MSIMSDRWIRSQCLPKPVPESLKVLGVQPPSLSRPMIDPFINGQVREVDGRKIVSYGLSSYGYDVRLGSKFKIFTNINNGLIDPLNMNDDCYVDFEGDCCIIPPNSYVLGHTIEYFRIPRDIMVICLGKCLAGSTLITDPLTGEIRQMADTAGLAQVEALDLGTGKISAQVTEGLINNGVLPMWTLTTKSGHRITATDTHPFRVWGGWKTLSELKPGDRIAVSAREPFSGKESISTSEARLLGYMTANGQCDVEGSSPVFTSLDGDTMASFKEAAEAYGLVYSPRDEHSVRLVNRQGQGGAMEKSRANHWLASHGLNVKSRDKTVPIAIQRANKEGLTAYLSALFTCDGSFQLRGINKSIAVLEYYTTSELLAEQIRILARRLGLFFTLRRTTKKLEGVSYRIFTLRTTSADTIRKFYETVGLVKGSRKESLMASWYGRDIVSLKSNFDTLPSEAWEDLDAVMTRLGVSYNSVGIHRDQRQSVPLTPLRDLAKATGDAELNALVSEDVIWDTVENIREDLAQPAYDYTVPGHHNFIANGLVVHNSTYARAGAIINVTPIEPEFEGQVVIEISNATNLPLKVHANQGIAQFLFLKGEAPCETSYADRGGKYQGQRGVVTARV